MDLHQGEEKQEGKLGVSMFADNRDRSSIITKNFKLA